MFEKLSRQPQDKIMELMSLFAADGRTEKIDLGVGVYKDSFGNTPVMQSVKESEKYLLENQITKKYVGLLGSIGFIDEMINWCVVSTKNLFEFNLPSPEIEIHFDYNNHEIHPQN